MIVKKIGIAACLIIFVSALSVSVTYAQTDGKEVRSENSSGKKMETRRQEIYKDLNLNDEQKKLLEENRNKRKERTKDLTNEIKAKREALRQELQKDQLNMEAINKINDDLKTTQAQMMDYRLEGILEVRKILTPEQFKKFMNKTDQRADHFKNAHKERKE